MSRVYRLGFLILTGLLAISSFQMNAQTNLALSATASHSGGGTGTYGPQNYNDGYYCNGSGTCWGWVSTSGNPSTSSWIEYQWTTSQTFDEIKVYINSTTNRAMHGFKVQYWNGSTYVDHHTFYIAPANLTLNYVDKFSSPITSTRLRLTDIYTTGSQAFNPMNEEIEVRLTTLPGLDVEMNRIEIPVTWSVGKNPLKVVYRNNRKDTIKWVDLGWRLNWDVPSLVNNYTKTVLPGAEQAYQFADSVYLPAKGSYNFRVWVSSPNDSFPDNVTSNDTLILSICTAMSGTYTIGGTGANYPTFNAAVTDLLKCGISGPVVFNVASGTYNERVVIPQILGASPTNTITFKGADKDNCILNYNSTSTSTIATLYLNGADYIKFQNMTIRAGGTSYGYSVLLNNTANYNTFYNCNLIVPVLSSTYCIPILASSSESSYSGYANNANYNTFENCLISGGYWGAYMTGPSTSIWCYGNKFIGNTFVNQYYSGIYNYYQREVLIKNNRIITNNSSLTDSWGIYHYYCVKSTIDGNIINPGWIGMQLYYENYYSTSDSSLIINNMIYNFKETGDQVGIYLYNYNYNMKVYNNTVYCTGTTTSTAYGRSCIFVYYCYASSIQNNILYSKNTTLLLSFYPYPYSASQVDYNDYIYENTNNSNMFYSNSVYYYDLAGWKTSTYNLVTPHDNNSWENIDPKFVSSTDPHLNSNYPPIYGKTISFITHDVDGDVRCPYSTTIGADESKYPVPRPKAFFVSDDTICHSTPIVFYNTADPKAKQGYWWYFNGNLVSKNFNWTHTFPAGTGYDTVSLVIINCGGADTFTKYVFVDNPSKAPKADFIADLNETEVMYPVNFSDLSINCPSGWKWKVYPATISHPILGIVPTYSFVTPTNEGSQNPVISFDYPGVYDVWLIAENGIGKDSIGKQKYVKVNPDYWMCFWADPSTKKSMEGTLYDDGGPAMDYGNNKNCDLALTPCAKQLDLTFKSFNLQSGDYLQVFDGTDANGTPLWDVSAYGTTGLTGNMTNPAFKSVLTSNSGKMYIKFTTNSSTVSSGFEAKWSGVYGNYDKPVASFNCPDTLCLGVTAYFENTSKSLPDASYEWYFTDPYFAESFDKNPGYKFAFDGTYTVKLKVIDCGGESEYTKDIVVVAPFNAPVPNFTADNVRPVKGTDIVNFSGEVYGCADEWKWTITPANFTNINGYPNTQFPQIRFNDTGCYDVKLVTGYKGMYDSITIKCFIKAIQYCQPTVDLLTQDIGMTKVILSDISNSTPIGKTEYSDYTLTHSTYLDVEATYDLQVERSSNFNTVDRKAWIDWNIDGDFDDPGELIGHEQNSSALVWKTSFKVPWNATLGPTRMRISTVLGGMANNPCGSRLFGEVEDYKVIVRPDGTPPVITMKGQDTVVLEQCTPSYTDAGATAMDNIDGNLTSAIVTTGSVDLKKDGTYYIRYNVSDNSGNKAVEKVRTVIVKKDNVPPVFSLKGNAKMIWEVLNPWVDPGYNVNDTCSGVDTVNITGTVDGSKLGVYQLEYTAYDKAGNSAVLTREVTVADTSDPVVWLNGYAVNYVEVHTPFTDSGLTVKDNYCFNNDIKVMGSYNVHKLGTYTLTYEVRDCAGNGPVIMNRVIVVYDSTAPVVTSSPYQSGDKILVDVYHNIDEYLPILNITDNYYQINEITVNKYGSYYTQFPNGEATTLGNFKVEIKVIDGSGNEAYLYFDIDVVDREKPVITLNGPQIIQICRFKEVPDSLLTAEVSDNYYTNVNITKTGTYYTDYLNTKKEGLFTVRYNAVDGSNNQAIEVVRYIDVIYDPQKCNVGVNEPLNENLVNIYPNPATHLVNVEVNLSGGEDLTISIINSVGEVVIERMMKSTGGIYTFDLSEFAGGIYMVRISTNGNTIVRPLMLSK